jgi:hypothetical protein
MNINFMEKNKISDQKHRRAKEMGKPCAWMRKSQLRWKQFMYLSINVCRGHKILLLLI